MKRTMTLASLLATMILLMTQCRPAIEEPTREILYWTGMKEGVAAYRIPALATAPNGDLIAAIDERVCNPWDLKDNEDINILVRRSEDNGKTWSDPVYAVNYELGKSASDPSLLVDRETGEIFLFYNYMDLRNEHMVFYLHYVKSADNGKTWSEAVDITPQITVPEWKHDFKFITSGHGIQTADGKLLHTLVNLNHGLHLFASDDHGGSWYLIDHAMQPADESKVIELTDGSWMVNCRLNNYDGKGPACRHIHITPDQGKTWTNFNEPQLTDPGCNASILRYSSKKDGDDKDRLLFANVCDTKERKNLVIRISYDEGKTWSEGKVICPGSAAYSDMTVLPDGSIGLFYEKDDYRANEFVKFTLEWLTDGQDRTPRK